MFVNLADVYYSAKGNPGPNGTDLKNQRAKRLGGAPDRPISGWASTGGRYSALPARYMIGCLDQLGLIVRRDNIWHKMSATAESADDRCATRHEYLCST